MMNTDSIWRLALAEKIAPLYSANPDVAAVVLIGGVARGRGDAYSDLDLTVYWTRPPTEQERRAAQVGIGEVLNTPVTVGALKQYAIFDYPNGEAYLYEEATYIGGDAQTGFKIDVTHETVDLIEWILDAVTHGLDTHGPKLERLYSIQRVKVFKGEALVQSWQAQAKVYPPALAVKLVQMHLSELRFDVQMHIHRDDLLLFYQAMTGAQHHLMGALLALNGIYRPELKRLDDLCAELTIRPDDLAGRIRWMLRDEPAKAAADFDRLVEEVFALVASHLPEVDMHEIRQRYWTRRQRYDTPVTA